MKYGMRERISGALILVALAVIFIPLLFDDPAPREERPEPVLTIEQPIDVERRDIEEPTPPESLDQNTGDDTQVAEESSSAVESDTATDVSSEPVESVVSQDQASGEAERQPAQDQPAQDQPAQDQDATANDDAANEQSATQGEDPIAELARAADERQAEATPDGEWAVQVGSFGQVENAERLQTRLEEQGYPAYRRARDNDLTTVYVGPYADSDVAENVMAKLKAGLNLQGLLVRTE